LSTCLKLFSTVACCLLLRRLVVDAASRAAARIILEDGEQNVNQFSTFFLQFYLFRFGMTIVNCQSGKYSTTRYLSRRKPVCWLSHLPNGRPGCPPGSPCSQSRWHSLPDGKGPRDRANQLRRVFQTRFMIEPIMCGYCSRLTASVKEVWAAFCLAG
jgi:hypothetical protein